MLTIPQLVRIALRHDTAMSRAMLRACGVPACEPRAVGTAVSVERYLGMRECFANAGSPMDGRR